MDRTCALVLRSYGKNGVHILVKKNCHITPILHLPSLDGPDLLMSHSISSPLRAPVKILLSKPVEQELSYFLRKDRRSIHTAISPRYVSAGTINFKPTSLPVVTGCFDVVSALSVTGLMV